MVGLTCAYISLGVGSVFAVLISIFGYALLPGVIESAIRNEVVLLENTEQWERFEEIPFPLTFNVYMFNLSNPASVLAGGVPSVTQVGPYVYKLYRERLIEGVDGDTVSYRSVDVYEFNAEASYPLRDDDLLTIVNPLYNAVLQAAEIVAPSLLGIMNTALNDIFGEFNSPIMSVPLKNLTFDGIRMCERPGVVATVACAVIRQLAATANNIQEVGNALEFSFLGYRTRPTPLYKVSRGLMAYSDLGLILEYNGAATLSTWPSYVELEGGGEAYRPQCNMLNGTDSAIFSPFVDVHKPLYAFNPDICRSVEMRYDSDTEYKGVKLHRFVTHEWFLEDSDGCYCVNATRGLNRPDGCLLPGVMEMYTCVGAPLVLSSPHFLFADQLYQNGVVGITPDVAQHRLFLDIEPNTGAPLRGSKRAQFNVFSRPVPGITATAQLRTVLAPMLWIEESVVVPDDLVDMIRTSLFVPLSLVPVLLPALIAAGGALALAGLAVLVRTKRALPAPLPAADEPPHRHSPSPLPTSAPSDK